MSLVTAIIFNIIALFDLMTHTENFSFADGYILLTYILYYAYYFLRINHT